ncbi:hypothetical protein BpHYR1_009489 [Brachionus plicatilis]|uniref:Uncharacterized protein n=1 Tax=Brachionus plicatilis TaxID=10195 RepID=A0A3M7S0H2_BRAPC|nr:hypothetical protein BpHYR1_009489 [Brachionus plicatilis]
MVIMSVNKLKMIRICMPFLNEMTLEQTRPFLKEHSFIKPKRRTITKIRSNRSKSLLIKIVLKSHLLNLFVKLQKEKLVLFEK